MGTAGAKTQANLWAACPTEWLLQVRPSPEPTLRQPALTPPTSSADILRTNTHQDLISATGSGNPRLGSNGLLDACPLQTPP